jgi:hypothetical protein
MSGTILEFPDHHETDHVDTGDWCDLCGEAMGEPVFSGEGDEGWLRWCDVCEQEGGPS